MLKQVKLLSKNKTLTECHSLIVSHKANRLFPLVLREPVSSFSDNVMDIKIIPRWLFHPNISAKHYHIISIFIVPKSQTKNAKSVQKV